MRGRLPSPLAGATLALPALAREVAAIRAAIEFGPLSGGYRRGRAGIRRLEEAD